MTRSGRRRTLARLSLVPAVLVLAAGPAAGETVLQRPERLDVPYVPTRQDVVDAMLRMAAVGGDDVVYDLGCGDGRIVIAAAQTFGARGVGIDIDPARIEEARANARRAGVESRTLFLVGDLFEADLAGATVVTLYLLPSINRQLKPRLRELAPGTRIVSHDFDMGTDWPPERTVKIGNSTVMLWTIGRGAPR